MHRSVTVSELTASELALSSFRSQNLLHLALRVFDLHRCRAERARQRSRNIRDLYERHLRLYGPHLHLYSLFLLLPLSSPRRKRGTRSRGHRSTATTCSAWRWSAASSSYPAPTRRSCGCFRRPGILWRISPTSPEPRPKSFWNPV